MNIFKKQKNYSNFFKTSILILTIVSFCFVSGCGSKQQPQYNVGLCPHWFSSGSSETNVKINLLLDFILANISKEAKVLFNINKLDKQILFADLEQKHLDVIITTANPSSHSCENYIFSSPILPLGPVLVVLKDSPISSFSDMSDKSLGISYYNENLVALDNNKYLNVHFYDSIEEGSHKLLKGNIDGLLLDCVNASKMVSTTYNHKMKIASPLLSNLSIRFCGIKKRDTKIIKLLNKHLQIMKKSGKMQELLENNSLLLENIAQKTK